MEVYPSPFRITAVASNHYLLFQPTVIPNEVRNLKLTEDGISEFRFLPLPEMV